MSSDTETARSGNFLRHIIERDLASGTYAARTFAGTPGDAAHHAGAPPDAARIRTRFPPEPNGYLHIGHAKSICLNFGLAQDYGGICHLRFDDTNPEKEEQEYVDAIVDAVHWLGFDWHAPEPALPGQAPTSHLYFASDYFDFMYRAAEALVEAGKAYVDEQSADEMRQHRGDFATPGSESPFRARTPAENLARLREMKDGRLADGAAVLRAKIDMASPNINLRDPALYRIKRATHHNTGDTWCIYPMYTYAHPIEDALENITHSICTLEFEDQRPFYDWLLETLCDLGLIARPRPHQYEFARLNVTYVITSKRKLKQLVDEGIVDGWDDPRMPTIAGLRRRGYTPESIRLMCERAGTSKAGGWTDYASLEIALRDDLDGKARRAMAVLDPVVLKLLNWAEVFGSEAHREACHAPAHPSRPELGDRSFALGPRVWIERDDFAETPAKGFFRLFAGNRVRLKYGYVVECTGCEKDASGAVTAVLARLVADTKSGTPGAGAVKVKGTITWVGQDDAIAVEVRLYDPLFTEAQPDAGGRDFKASLNPESRKIVSGFVEPTLADSKAGDRLQFERHGYFVADDHDHSPGRPVFGRIATLKDTWARSPFRERNLKSILLRAAGSALLLLVLPSLGAAQGASASSPAAIAAASTGGLEYRSIREGSGMSPTASDRVKVHYRGTLADGREFDSSYRRNAPATFPLGGVIKCWTEGVQRMKPGGKALLICPPHLAYGERGAGGVIPPNATLQFEIELLEINPR